MNHPAIPDDVRRQFVRNLWVRAALLGRHDVAQVLDQKYPQETHRWAASNPQDLPKLLQQYAAAATPEEKEFAAVFLLQHEYGAGYDMNTGESWCASAAAFPEDIANSLLPAEAQKPTTFGAAGFLNDAERKQVADEQNKLDHLDSQANYFVRTVLAFAKAHPDDPRVPEALSRAVANTRMNCSNPRTGPLSKEAFELLHKRYPDDLWAKRTKYWFD